MTIVSSLRKMLAKRPIGFRHNVAARVRQALEQSATSSTLGSWPGKRVGRTTLYSNRREALRDWRYGIETSDCPAIVRGELASKMRYRLPLAESGHRSGHASSTGGLHFAHERHNLDRG